MRSSPIGTANDWRKLECFESTARSSSHLLGLRAILVTAQQPSRTESKFDGIPYIQSHDGSKDCRRVELHVGTSRVT
jgi:hypothetical protein